MVSYLINKTFARPLENFFSGTVVAIAVVVTDEQGSIICHEIVKEKSCATYGDDLLSFTQRKAWRLYCGVLRVLRETGVSRSQLRREDHQYLIMKAVRVAYEESYQHNIQYSRRVQWDSFCEVGDRLSFVSESCSPIGGSDEAN